MAFGTAGYTAALCVHRMEDNGQRPEMGAIVVTGATGGVGSIAVRLLAARSYQVIALSGRPSITAGCESSAPATYARSSSSARRQTARATRFGGAIDNVGGTLLAQLLPHIVEWGNVASVGLAGGAEFATSVYPFILRGVSLLGASSANSPMSLRREIWHGSAATSTSPTSNAS